MEADSDFLAEKMRRDNNVCSMQIVFADISAYSRRKSYSQVSTILALTECFKQAVETTASTYSARLARLQVHLQNDTVVLPTGDGIAVAFPFDGFPGLSIDFVDSLVTAVDAHNKQQGGCAAFYENGFCDCHTLLQLRIGVSEGATVLYEDFNRRLNVAGNPVNMAARVMDLAEPGQVLVTDDAYRTLINHVPGSEQQFRTYFRVEIKHGHRIDVHQYINAKLTGLDVTARAGLGLMETETQPDIVEIEVVAEPDHSETGTGSDTAFPTESPSRDHADELPMVSVEDLGLSMADDNAGRVDLYFSRPFLIGTRPVTQDEYQVLMGRNPSLFIGGSHPVEMVSWLDAVQFCNELSASHGFEAVYDIIEQEVDADITRNGYRLPTEAEWEHCCRGGSGEDRYGSIDEIAWYSANAEGRTHPVCEKSPNRGVYDLLGNVWEWCGDWFQRGRPADSEIDYVGPPTGYERVLRGGSWRDLLACITAGYRHRAVPTKRENTIGFRVVRTLPTKPQT